MMKKIFCKLFYLSIFVLSLVNTACAVSSDPIESIISDSLKERSTESQRTQLHDMIKWPASCNETFDYPVAGFNFFKINSTSYILQVTCTYGAYQGMSLFYKVSIENKSIKYDQLKLPQSYSDKKGETEIWGNVLTDSKPDSFNILNQYSGFGQCGRLTTYDLTKTTPEIVSQYREEDCDKKPAVRDPYGWPEIKPH